FRHPCGFAWDAAQTASCEDRNRKRVVEIRGQAEGARAFGLGLRSGHGSGSEASARAEEVEGCAFVFYKCYCRGCSRASEGAARDEDHCEITERRLGRPKKWGKEASSW